MDLIKMKQEIDRNWCFVEEEFDIKKNRHYESVLALGTGYITTRASFEEGFENDDQSKEFNRFMNNVTLEKIAAEKSKWGSYMPVIQARHPFLNMNNVNLPYYLGYEIVVDGEKLDMEKAKMQDYLRWLDIKTATLYRVFQWETKSGKSILVSFKRFMNPVQRFICVQQCELIMLKGDCKFEIHSFIDNNVRTNGFDMYAKHEIGVAEPDIIYSDVVTHFGNRIITASRTVSNVKTSASVAGCVKTASLLSQNH